MRIYTRTDFLALQPGTLFCKGTRWCFGPLCVKGDSIPTGGDGDFWYRDLAWIDRHNDDDQWAKLTAMLDQGTHEPLNTGQQRDGLYEREALFLVYDAADLRQLLAVCHAAMVLAH